MLNIGCEIATMLQKLPDAEDSSNDDTVKVGAMMMY